MKPALPLRRSHGYTIDQTILIVAIIAILVTLIIITVGWNLINKSSGTKLGAQLRQVEDANAQFYSSYRVWPEDSYGTPNSTNAPFNILALQGSTAVGTYVSQVTNSPDAVNNATPKNMLSGFKTNGTSNVYHNFGDGLATNKVEQLVVNNPFGLNGNFLVVEFQNVPMSDVKNAEQAIDNDANANATTAYQTGRVVATTAGTECMVATVPGGITNATPDSQKVNVCYAANLVQ